MRDLKEKDGVSVKAYAGNTGILLAMNRDKKPEKDFLGWAIKRVGPSGDPEFLRGMIPFPHMKDHKAGEQIPSDKAPIQKFRWSDYSVVPDTIYKYTIHPVFGDPANPQLRDGPTVKVKTHSLTGGPHRIIFNRAAAASQAFSRKFRTVSQKMSKVKKKGRVHLPHEAWVWLSRGLKEAIVETIECAVDNTWALDVAIYEYEQDDIVAAVRAAHQRGAAVRVIYHAKSKDKQTGENEEALARLPKKIKRARKTSKIFHHKFIVLSRVQGGVRTRDRVLCGSANFTENGVYRQANVVHITTEAALCDAYLAHFDELWLQLGRDEGPGATKKFIDAHNAIDLAKPAYVGFSPRSKFADIDAMAKIIDGAKRDVFFCTAFNIHDDLQKALKGKAHDPILRYGVQDKQSKMTGTHADRTAQFVATAMLKSGLEGFLKESLTGLGTGLLIHTKIVVVDFTSDHPTVISGSHNLSGPASSGNDENFIVFKGNKDVADVYGVEVMRIYDHYRFRFQQKKASQAKKRQPRILLKTDNAWALKYYKPKTLSRADRVCFC